MDDKKTGGAAFPDPGRAQSAKQREIIIDTGMTMRDYFAAKALVALFTHAAVMREDALPVEQAAKVAYRYADAMLLERAKP